MAAKAGAKHHNAKMTVAKVRAARKAHAKGKVSIVALATKYGISTQAMWQIIHRKTWKSVED